MAKNKKAEQGDKNLGNIESALTKTELYIENNQKLLINIFAGILAVVLLVIAGNRYVLQPRNQEAAASMYMAEKYFERDSFNLALNGYGTYPGFLDIIDEYSFTKSANLAKYYAGICYKEMGNFEDAIRSLNKFRSNDLLVSATAESAIGDSYAELGEYNKAIKAYLNAAKKYDNQFTSPIIMKKAGLVYEQMGDLEKALDIYQQIKDQYPESSEGNEMKKYIGRVEAKLADL